MTKRTIKDARATRICVVKDVIQDTTQDVSNILINILTDTANRLGHLRSDIWNQYGSLKAWGISKITLDPIHRNEHPVKYGIPAKLWEATFYDCIDNIHAVQAAAITFALRELGLHPRSVEGNRIKSILESRDWFEYPEGTAQDELKELKRLHRLMRHHYKRGHTYKRNQIILKQYKSYVDKDGDVCVKFVYAKLPNQNSKSCLKIGFKTTANQPFTGQIRLLICDSIIEIHKPEKYDTIRETEKLSPIKVKAQLPSDKIIGVDRGYTEVYATSDKRLLGEDFGKLQSTETEHRSHKGRKRNKLRALAQKAKSKGNNAKHDRILANNLGKKKWNAREKSFTGRIRTYVYTATLQLFADAGKVVYEDLSTPIKGGDKKYSKRNRNKLNQYTKGVVVKALETVPQRFGKVSVAVNAAYTSQIDSSLNLLLGKREGDRFYQFWGGVVQSDINAGQNVLAREQDSEIGVYTKHKEVLRILIERTVKYLVVTVQSGKLQLTDVKSSNLIRPDVKKRFLKVWANLQPDANTGMGIPKTLDSIKPRKSLRGRKGEP
ncbi:hypothetical protein WA1_33815 [Scytonema hofmannii PCC 7110]|uniref:Transposase n=1 Tax=Scytonema hofmannii PCC 7110 TaxID=128403 RepID=A0A139X2S1_9CYAN|nr:hypothetical protein [Scytonema hofmannii]KYC38974.1 hypothetical protein WA1_33815 [Scytonema hofmannii PCC 7110]